MIAKTKAMQVREFPFAELTNSARSTFATCRQKFYWSYIARLAPIKENKFFMIGRLFHAGLEAMYKVLSYNKEEMDLMVDTEVDKAAIGCTDTAASDELWKQSAITKAMLEGYAAHYLQQDKKTWKVLAPETVFSFRLKGGWENRGQRDLLVERGGKLGLVEHKTTTILDAGYIAKLPMDTQILSYAISCKKDPKIGRYPAFIVYNVCRKSQLRLKQTESMAQFYERIRQEYLLNPSLYYYREVLSFSKLDLEAYEADLERFAAEMARSIKEHYYYRNYNACTMYGPCQFMPLCQARLAKAFDEARLGYRVKEEAHEELTQNE